MTRAQVTLRSGFGGVVQALIVVMLVCLAGPAFSKTSSSKYSRTGEVYLFRGTGAIFSGGMDVIARKLSRRGVRTKVLTHRSWSRVSRDIIKRSKARKVSYPIILMGHSAGGRAALKLAKTLSKRGIPVRYIVTFDPNTREAVGSKVSRVTNYYIANANNSNVLLRGRGFRGSLQNRNVSRVSGLNHFNIEKNGKFQNRVVNSAVSYTRKK